eukprot:gnl/Dysnectes_brevis/4101_a5383_552.p1 GENE.gnl/Dysnectes_brevis/4101_a5383_552~~gnl/Dysnectes_brevis/4101_a5383_552.p1  ORF type:complete len:1186 (+),score=232.35 gnl/Dysnectes_brevis/4101_a5383_552:984-4541(+)
MSHLSQILDIIPILETHGIRVETIKKLMDESSTVIPPEDIEDVINQLDELEETLFKEYDQIHTSFLQKHDLYTKTMASHSSFAAHSISHLQDLQDALSDIQSSVARAGDRTELLQRQVDVLEEQLYCLKLFNEFTICQLVGGVKETRDTSSANRTRARDATDDFSSEDESDYVGGDLGSETSETSETSASTSRDSLPTLSFEGVDQTDIESSLFIPPAFRKLLAHPATRHQALHIIKRTALLLGPSTDTGLSVPRQDSIPREALQTAYSGSLMSLRGVEERLRLPVKSKRLQKAVTAALELINTLSSVIPNHISSHTLDSALRRPDLPDMPRARRASETLALVGYPPHRGLLVLLATNLIKLPELPDVLSAVPDVVTCSPRDARRLLAVNMPFLVGHGALISKVVEGVAGLCRLVLHVFPEPIVAASAALKTVFEPFLSEQCRNILSRSDTQLDRLRVLAMIHRACHEILAPQLISITVDFIDEDDRMIDPDWKHLLGVDDPWGLTLERHHTATVDTPRGVDEHHAVKGAASIDIGDQSEMSFDLDDLDVQSMSLGDESDPPHPTADESLASPAILDSLAHHSSFGESMALEGERDVAAAAADGDAERGDGDIGLSHTGPFTLPAGASALPPLPNGMCRHITVNLKHNAPPYPGITPPADSSELAFTPPDPISQVSTANPTAKKSSKNSRDKPRSSSASSRLAPAAVSGPPLSYRLLDPPTVLQAVNELCASLVHQSPQYVQDETAALRELVRTHHTAHPRVPTVIASRFKKQMSSLYTREAVFNLLNHLVEAKHRACLLTSGEERRAILPRLLSAFLGPLRERLKLGASEAARITLLLGGPYLEVDSEALLKGIDRPMAPIPLAVPEGVSGKPRGVTDPPPGFCFPPIPCELLSSDNTVSTHLRKMPVVGLLLETCEVIMLTVSRMSEIIESEFMPELEGDDKRIDQSKKSFEEFQVQMERVINGVMRIYIEGVTCGINSIFSAVTNPNIYCADTMSDSSSPFASDPTPEYSHRITELLEHQISIIDKRKLPKEAKLALRYNLGSRLVSSFLSSLSRFPIEPMGTIILTSEAAHYSRCVETLGSVDESLTDSLDDYIQLLDGVRGIFTVKSPARLRSFLGDARGHRRCLHRRWPQPTMMMLRRRIWAERRSDQPEGWRSLLLRRPLKKGEDPVEMAVRGVLEAL